MADLSWPKGFSISYSFMTSNKTWGREDGVGVLPSEVGIVRHPSAVGSDD